MKQTGVVVKTENDMANVRFFRSSACGGNCTSCGGCGGKPAVAEAYNSIGAAPGDEVVIETDTKAVLTGAFFAYIVPLAAAFLGYALLGIAGAAVFFALPYAIFHLINKKTEKIFRPKVVEIVKRARQNDV